MTLSHNDYTNDSWEVDTFRNLCYHNSISRKGDYNEKEEGKSLPELYTLIAAAMFNLKSLDTPMDEIKQAVIESDFPTDVTNNLNDLADGVYASSEQAERRFFMLLAWKKKDELMSSLRVASMLASQLEHEKHQLAYTGRDRKDYFDPEPLVEADRFYVRRLARKMSGTRI